MSMPSMGTRPSLSATLIASALQPRETDNRQVREASMDNYAPAARAAIVADNQWENALEQALAQVKDLENIDVVILFASSFYDESFPEMLTRVREATGGAVLLGCAGQGVIGRGQESG